MLKNKKRLLTFWLPLAAIAGLGICASVVAYVYNDNKPNTAVIEHTEEISPGALAYIVDEVRKKAGVTELEYVTDLNSSAKLKCDDMVANNYYDHVNPASGKHGYEYITMEGTGFRSENLNKGVFKTNQSVVDSWMGSEQHRKAILEPANKYVGYAVCTSADKQTLVVQHFARPSDAASETDAPEGATARCCDGVYSHSTGRGTCSHHDSVCEWL